MAWGPAPATRTVAALFAGLVAIGFAGCTNDSLERRPEWTDFGDDPVLWWPAATERETPVPRSEDLEGGVAGPDSPRDPRKGEPEGPMVRAILLFDETVEDPWAIAAQCACRCGVRIRHVYAAAFRGCAVDMPSRNADRLLATQGVRRVAPDRIFQALAKPAPAGVARIGAAAAIERGLTGRGIRVAVLDTGIDLDHPLLAGKIDLELSKNFVSSDPRPAQDDNGHGTHVAGIVAAEGDQAFGVAPGSRLVSLKVLDETGLALESNIIAALDHVAIHNRSATRYEDLIHVANMSLGGPGDDEESPLHDAVIACVKSGAVVVVAAGNEGSDSEDMVPASFDEVITVSAFDPAKDSLAEFSNYGADVDVAAPGVDVLSALLGGGTVAHSGTSMASPHVSGAAAQFLAANLTQAAGLWARDPAAIAPFVRQRLIATGEWPAGSGARAPSSWPGDSDGYPEPLVDVDGLLGLSPSEEVVAAEKALPSESAVLHVEGIDYRDDGEAVWVEIEVVDSSGEPVSGVEVGIGLCIDLSGGGREHRLGEGAWTDPEGTATFHVPEAVPGRYRADVRSLDKEGYARDAARDAPDRGHDRP